MSPGLGAGLSTPSSQQSLSPGQSRTTTSPPQMTQQPPRVPTHGVPRQSLVGESAGSLSGLSAASRLAEVSPRGEGHRFWNRDKEKARLATVASPLLKLYVLVRSWLGGVVPRKVLDSGHAGFSGTVKADLEYLGLAALVAGEMCLHDLSPVSHRAVLGSEYALPSCTSKLRVVLWGACRVDYVLA